MKRLRISFARGGGVSYFGWGERPTGLRARLPAAPRCEHHAMPVKMRMTKDDVILLAANKLEVRPFTAEDLTVAAWQLSPDMFGLDGFKTRYPNNNSVLCCLMGQKGLVARNKLVQVGEGAKRRYTIPS